MIPDPLRLGFEERTGVLQQTPPPRQVAAERPIGEEAVEMPFEDHPVERLDHARDGRAMQIDETVHGCPAGRRCGSPDRQGGDPGSPSQIRTTSGSPPLVAARRPRYEDTAFPCGSVT